METKNESMNSNAMTEIPAQGTPENSEMKNGGADFEDIGFPSEADDAADVTAEEDGVFVYDADADLAEMHAQFPQLSEVASLSDIKNHERFTQLRALGLSVREALLATNGQVTGRGAAYDNRSHLKSAVPRTGTSGGVQMSRAELSAARELFGSLTEREIKELYKRVRN